MGYWENRRNKENEHIIKCPNCNHKLIIGKNGVKCSFCNYKNLKKVEQ